MQSPVFSETADDSPSPGGEGRGEVEHPAHVQIHTLGDSGATAFKSKEHAKAFERYLKSGSGRAFVQRHL